MELHPVKETETDATYFSPFRNEKTPSFHVNKLKNLWFDHGEGIGGNAVDLVIQILKASGHRYSPKDALRWFRNTNLDPALPIPRDIVRDKQSKWRVLDTFNLIDHFLIRYLETRGIDIKIAKMYVNEIYNYTKVLRPDRNHSSLPWECMIDLEK
ncbi:CHC2 zinc finger domain-containing protein [Mucilaginibacter calamicampi]|uniref:CHC2 zinc finger domain-containing protein n=1 Tax=Mucilaginibacter calamicampi TaxID=1302352 RepID=A0ABW2Z5B6_9SPHI